MTLLMWDLKRSRNELYASNDQRMYRCSRNICQKNTVLSQFDNLETSRQKSYISFFYNVGNFSRSTRVKVQ